MKISTQFTWLEMVKLVAVHIKNP
ncbi:hypothetical protein NGA_0084002, partial [Nannochloropsis gaditana CCMP526]